jgi:hypothetical protein
VQPAARAAQPAESIEETVEMKRGAENRIKYGSEDVVKEEAPGELYRRSCNTFRNTAEMDLPTPLRLTAAKILMEEEG